MRYRPDIDGLRGIAVFIVVACHAQVPGFAGGFVGVDVFFVISGFLITGLLVHEQQTTGRISLANFCARRVRRLAPALGLVIATTVSVGFFVLTPAGEQQSLAQSAIASATFVSNLFFAIARSGYFTEKMRYVPMLHTWSLGVEEQFYIVWPLLITATAALGKRWRMQGSRLLFAAIATATALSAILCFIVIDISETLAFFSFPTRAWEVGAGALLAFLAPPSAGERQVKPRLWPNAVGFAGLAIILGVTVFNPEGVAFTAIPSALAVVGTVLVLSNGALSPGGLMARTLSAAPLRAIGKVSYDWYLWHWPLLALNRVWAMGEMSLIRDVSWSLAALGLAFASYHLLEYPVRRQRVWPFGTTRGTLIAGGTILSLCVAMAGALWLSAHAALARDPVAQQAAFAMAHPVNLGGACNGMSSDVIRPGPLETCRVGPKGHGLVLLWGDSHAMHLLPGLEQASHATGIGVYPVVKSNCRASLRPNSEKPNSCDQFNDAVSDMLPDLQRSHALSGVILGGRWQGDASRPALDARVRSLRSQGLRVLLVADVADYAYSVPVCVARLGAARCMRQRSDVDLARAVDLVGLGRLSAGDTGVRVWDPLDTLCSRGRCEVTAADGVLLYTDTHHISDRGSRMLSSSLQPELEWLSGHDLPR